MALPASVRVSPDVVAQQVGEETVLLNLKTGVYWGLNPTGAAIWEEIVKDGNVPRIVNVLKTRYEASEEQLAAAIEDLLEQLAREGLVVLDVSR